MNEVREYEPMIGPDHDDWIPPAEGRSVMCSADKEGWTCTVRAGHTIDHAAHIGYGSFMAARWPRETDSANTPTCDRDPVSVVSYD